MLKKHRIYLIAGMTLCAFSTTKVSAEEACVARYDATNNIAYIPCVTIGDKRIWANLRLLPSGDTFVVEGSGENFLPLWLMQKIDGFIADPTTERPLSIRQFEYKEATVYYFTSQCCEQLNYLYNTTGTIICAPDGGFSGSGDGQCPDFADTSTAGAVIWEDKKIN